MKNGMTKREFLMDVIANYEGITDEGKAIAQKMIDQLEKKSANGGKPTKRQVENEDIKVRIQEFLDANGAATATEIANGVDISCQRASALLKQMGVPKAKVKGKMIYGTAEPVDDPAEEVFIGEHHGGEE